jgi:hypothetical protein
MDSSFVINPAITPYTRGGGGIESWIITKKRNKSSGAYMR